MSRVTMDMLILDEGLINEFREVINESATLNDILKQDQGRNKLNAVYSSMDWINVAVEGTKHLDINVRGMGYNHLNTLKVLQYIMVIDLITESVKQLHRSLEVIGVEYDLKNDNKVFGKEISDDDYFKHLRAIFGVHPVNLKSIDGSASQNHNERYFGSWIAHDMSGDYDFISIIYKNQVDDDSSSFIGLNLLELDRYVKLRYVLLRQLIDTIICFTSSQIESYKSSRIEWRENYKENLTILFDENKKRFGNYRGYHFLLNYLLRMKSVIDVIATSAVEYNPSIIENYQNRLEEIATQIKENLEKMQYEELKIGICARGYEFEKIGQYLIDGKHPVGEEYFNGLIKYEFLPSDIHSLEDLKSIGFLFDAYLYYYQSETASSYITYVELVGEENLIQKGALSFTGYFL